MRGLFGMAALLSLAGCGGASADVTGSAGGVDFGSTRHVYFGGPFVVISMLDVACDEIDWVRRNYEVGSAPTPSDTQVLQFSFMDSSVVTTGPYPVLLTGAVSSSVIQISGGAFYETIAGGGLLTVDEVVDEDHATGTFEGIAFEDGTLEGSFDATWCRNLKAR